MPILTVYQCEKCRLKFADEANVVVSKGGKVLCERCLAELLGETPPARKCRRVPLRKLTLKNNIRFYERLRDYFDRCCAAGKCAYEPQAYKRQAVVLDIYDDCYDEVMQGVSELKARFEAREREKQQELNLN